MRLKEIKIERYGPLPPIHWHLNEGVQPVYGPNESGKTLIVEALLKMFAGERALFPSEINRVEETPEGYIILDDAGKETKLDRDKTLSGLLGLEPEELRNVFIVRNADVQIEREDVFYERVSDKLAGLWTKDIRKVEQRLKEAGRLTDTLRLSDAEVYSKAKSQLKDAERLIKDAEEYLEKAEEDGIRDLEAKGLELETKENQLRNQIDVLKVKKLANAYNNARSKLRESRQIPTKEILTFKTDLEVASRDESERPRLERNVTIYKNLSYLSVLGCSITFASLLLAGFDVIANLLIPGPFLISFLALLLLHHRANNNLANIERKLNSVVSKGQEFKLKVSSIEELRVEIGAIENRVKNLEQTLNQNIGVLKDGLGIEVESPEEVLSKASKELQEMRDAYGLGEDVSYRKGQLEEAKEKHDKITGELSQLKELLKKHRGALEDFKKAALSLNFKAFLGQELDFMIENLESLSQLSKRLSRFIRQIEEDADLSRTAVEIFQQMESEEEEKISELFGKDSEAAEIFKEITDGRYTKVKYNRGRSEIFVERSTGEVRYPSKELSGSKGTVDQLYLAIRIALGRDILQGESGFFILDDPLAFSDETRVERQLDLLRKLSRMSWQILYFTSDQAVSDAISQLTDNKAIQLRIIL